MKRTVHIRMKDETIVKCLDMLEIMGGISTKGMPTSSAVNQALEALLRGVQGIPVRSDEEIKARMSEASPSETPAAGQGIVPVFDAPEDQDEEETPMSLLKKHVERQVQEMSSPQLEVPLSVKSPDEVEDIPDDIRVDFSKAKRLPFDKIKKSCPKDRLVEEAENNPHLIAALEIVYANIPIDMWGGPKAEELVREIYNQHLKYGLEEEDDE